MIEATETGDVVRMIVRDHLSTSDLEQVTELVEAAIKARPKTHFFIEAHDFKGFGLASLADYLPRAAALLGKLDRFGRVAIVTDQAWLRWVARLESALLPNISYELFTPAEHASALAWVEGRSTLPHGPAISVIETDRPEVIGFEIDGKPSATETKAVTAYFNAAMDRCKPLRVFGRVRALDGVEIAAVFGRDYLAMKRRALGAIERYAVVGGPSWLEAWVNALKPLVTTELRWFEPAEEPLAWAWLGAQPLRQVAVVD